MPRLAVLGHPVSHSRSPAMHSAALEEMGLGADWSYEAIDVGADDFLRAVRGLPADGFAGVNVTVPHKVAALAVATNASEAAVWIGAANTLTFEAGGIAAENTDAPGIIAALPASPKGRRALVLGAGGSARAAVWALRDAGASVAVWNRTPERARRLAAELDAEAISAGEGEALPLAEFDLVVNTTTVGLEAANPAPGSQLGADPDRGVASLKSLPLDADGLNTSHVLVDLVYGTAETPLAAVARARGAEVVDGLEVLVRQGAASLRIWTGQEPPIETMRRAARAG